LPTASLADRLRTGGSPGQPRPPVGGPTAGHRLPCGCRPADRLRTTVSPRGAPAASAVLPVRLARLGESARGRRLVPLPATASRLGADRHRWQGAGPRQIDRIAQPAARRSGLAAGPDLLTP